MAIDCYGGVAVRDGSVLQQQQQQKEIGKEREKRREREREIKSGSFSATSSQLLL